MGTYEHDRMQCQITTTKKQRCVRIATHSNGGKLMCEAHHGQYVGKKLQENKVEKPCHDAPR